jgi:hypothetical protein
MGREASCIGIGIMIESNHLNPRPGCRLGQHTRRTAHYEQFFRQVDGLRAPTW